MPIIKTASKSDALFVVLGKSNSNGTSGLEKAKSKRLGSIILKPLAFIGKAHRLNQPDIKAPLRLAVTTKWQNSSDSENSSTSSKRVLEVTENDLDEQGQIPLSKLLSKDFKFEESSGGEFKHILYPNSRLQKISITIAEPKFTGPKHKKNVRELTFERVVPPAVISVSLDISSEHFFQDIC